MKHFCYKRLKGKTLQGEVNLSYGTIVESTNTNLIYYNNQPLCYTTSQTSIDHFVSNEDGRGEERGKLVLDIKKTLSQNENKWDNIWEDDVSTKYKKKGLGDHFLWDYTFFNASIEDLEHILQVAKKRVKKSVVEETIEGDK